MRKLVLIITVFFLAAMKMPVSESRNITGKVTSIEDGNGIPGVNVIIKGTTIGTVTDMDGKFEILINSNADILVFSSVGYLKEEIAIGEKSIIDISLRPDTRQLEEVVVIGYSTQKKSDITGSVSVISSKKRSRKGARSPKFKRSTPSPNVTSGAAYGYYSPNDQQVIQHNTEGYSTINENSFLTTNQNPLSTFSIDVDVASYANMRRFINNGSRPPKDAVRIEEMINYFTYDYPQPKGEDPFSVNTEISVAPWNSEHRLVHIGLQGKKIPTENLPASNLVFLIDVSGSMSSSNKLPLLKSSFKLLVDELRPEDKVAIVVYAGAVGVVLPSTSGEKKDVIISALDRLQAGGSTAGGAGIELAYKIAQNNFIQGGNNRVILATDGDFNVGSSSNAEMERLIEKKRESGVFLTTLGYGMGNYKDDKMEILANKGNGNYAYIDNIQEAKKTLVNEFGGTLFTIAKDVKLQIEFNPTKVQAYRLIGYENRMLADEDFNDDKKDAGELGSGHTVTALYEIIPVGVTSEFIRNVDELKYQTNQKITPVAATSNEIMTVKFRYKKPNGSKSRLIQKSVMDHSTELNVTSENFRWSAAVAAYGMILRDSEFKGNSNRNLVIDLAKSARGEDKEGYRAEFIRLVKSSQFLAMN